jgi:DNA-binding GntR family transcriptional regulator
MSETVMISELSRTPLRLQVARELRRLLRAGYYNPGTRVTEKSVAEALSVSKTPAREALSVLGENGVLWHVPNGGFEVPLLTMGEIGKLFECRAILEFPALKMAIENLQPGTASDLLDKHHELMEATAENNAARFIEAFLSFRKSLFADCGNDLLISFIERIDNQTEALKVRAFAHPDVRTLIVDQYGQLMRAVVNGDIEGAQTILAEHHRLGRRAYEAAIGDLPSPGRNGNPPGRD